MFDPLSQEAVRSIADIEIDTFAKRVESLGYELTADNSVYEFITKKGYDAQLGARPLKRAVQTYLEDKVCELMMDESENKQKIIVRVSEDGKNLDVSWE